MLMKAQNILNLLILWTLLVTGVVSANQNVVYREISDREKQAMIDEYQRLLDAHRKQNNGAIDLAVVKPYVTEMVGDFYNQELISAEEVEKLKARFESIENKTSLSDQQKYDQLVDLLKMTIDEVQRTPMQCMASTQSCNQKSCCPGLVCAPEPRKGGRKSGKGFFAGISEGNTFAFSFGHAQKCKKDGDCESGKCHLPSDNPHKAINDDESFALAGMSGDKKFDKKIQDKFKKKQEKRKRLLAQGHGRCEPVKRCYQPVAVGGDCSDNPVCAAGSCKRVNANTNFLGECKAVKNKCSSDNECCSGSCERNRCVSKFICKQCVANGDRVKRGKKCCEGLIPNKRGRCVPDAPPMLLLQNKFGPKNLLKTALDFMIPKAHADADSEARAIVQEQIDNNNIPGEFNPANNLSLDGVELVKDEAKKIHSDQVPYFKITEGSDFENCKIDFRQDYYLQLKERDMLRAEASLLAFEFVSLGPGTDDFWKKDGKSIHGQFKSIAEKLQTSRRVFNEDLVETNRMLTCLCLDSKGYQFITSTQQTYFRDSCSEEYEAHLALEEKMKEKEEVGGATATAKSIEKGDASSIKYLRLMKTWADKMAELKGKSLVRNVAALNETNIAKEYLVGSAPWNQTEVKNYELYQFTIQNLKTGALVMGAAAGALISAGAIAIAGGFATASTLTAWAATGIIAASSLAGAGGFWLLGALRGAWQAKTPTISDSFVKGRESYKCGKKSQCSDFKRVLKQPYNPVCGIHASSNACVKHFIVTNEAEVQLDRPTNNTMNQSKADMQKHFNEVIQLGDGNQMYFIIDPWVPYGMKKSDIMGNQPVYTTLLNEGFQSALRYLRNGRPSGYQGSGYLNSNVIGSTATAHYAPKLAEQSAYQFSANEKQALLEAAKKYAIDEEFFAADQTEFLEDFANYTYQFHFIYPKAVPVTEGNIAYPPPGLSTYAQIIQFGLGRITTTNEEEFRNLVKMQAEYRNLLQDRLKIYRDSNQLGEQEVIAINSEISRLQGEIEDLQGFQGIATNLAGNNVDVGGLNGGSNALLGEIQSTGLSSVANSKGVVSSLRTLGRLREEAREDQEAFNKNMVGNEARKNALLAAQKDMVDSFFNPLGTAKNSFFSSANPTGEGNVTGGAGLTATGNKAGNIDTKGLYGKGAVGKLDNRNLNNGAANFNNRRGGGLGSDSSLGAEGGLGLDIGSGAFTGDAASQGQISAAIKARNSQSSKKFQRDDEDSLFEILTKAYIRNYDRVLNKKAKPE